MYTYIDHTALKDSENVNGLFVIKAKITSEAGPVNNIKLFYNTGGNETSISMIPTSTPDEYQATITATGNPATYGYYISVNDNLNRAYTAPGKLIDRTQGILQTYHYFSTGPDVKAPRITHSPKKYVIDSQNELIIEAIISDNIEIGEAKVEYLINNVAQPTLTMTPGSPDSLYAATISLSGIVKGDIIKYRITARDNAAAQNSAIVPASNYYEVNVVGLGPTQDLYANDFNSPSDDFFGEGFSITEPTGFGNPAIHSDHPYQQGNGFPGNELNLTYQLSVPIRVKEEQATVKFDEIVLVEPGESGSVFGSEEFYDYVVVEGSLDGGITWTAIADGYDSRSDNAWLAKWSSAIVSDNSTATGDSTLYRTRIIDLLNAFNPGDEVVIRFRLFSDPFAAGWGWAIDNLKIQIDEFPPAILNDHVDYMVAGQSDTLFITTKVTDPSGVQQLSIEYNLNGGTLQSEQFTIGTNQSEYTLALLTDNLSAGDKISYRIVAGDSLNNVGNFPAAGFILVPVIAFGSPVNEYINDFNSPSGDFVGNFFEITKPAGFGNSAIHTSHAYLNGAGLNKTSNFTYTLTKPVIVNANNHYMRFDEIVIVEPQAEGVLFGTPEFNDYVIVEASDDQGVTWKALRNGYDATAHSTWLNIFNDNKVPNLGHYKSRTISLTSSGDFQAGDQLIIRFRMFAANPLGKEIFSRGKEKLNFTLKKNESVTFRYRVVIHEATLLTNADIEKLAKSFAKID